MSMVVRVEGQTDKINYSDDEDVVITGKVRGILLGAKVFRVNLIREVTEKRQAKSQQFISVDGSFRFVDTTHPWTDVGETKEAIRANGITFTLEAWRFLVASDEVTLPKINIA